jgi:hypothetical protein
MCQSWTVKGLYAIDGSVHADRRCVEPVDHDDRERLSRLLADSEGGVRMIVIHDPLRSPHAPETARFGLHGAIVAGADALRLPVRLSSDGYAVVLEDETTHRLTGKAGSVANLTLKELRALDFGATFKSADGKPFAYRARVETLPMLLDALPDDVWYRRRQTGSRYEAQEAAAQQVAKAAVNRGIDARVVLYSNDATVRSEARKVSERITLAADAPDGVDAIVVSLDAILANRQSRQPCASARIVVSPRRVSMPSSTRNCAARDGVGRHDEFDARLRAAHASRLGVGG